MPSRILFTRVVSLTGSTLLGMVLAVAALVALPAVRLVAAPAAMIYTYPGASPCNTTLQACINAAAPGDTIKI